MSGITETTTANRRQAKSEEIKAAVKEALNDRRMDDIASQLHSLSTQMTAGFAAVHARQDTANGKLMAHQTKFELLEADKNNKSSYDKWVWLAVTTLLSTVVGFVVYLTK